MEIEDLVDATETLAAAKDNALATLMEQAMNEAQIGGLRALPASIDGETVVSLDSDALQVAEVVDSARVGGAALLYVHHELADTGPAATAVAEADFPAKCPERDRLVKALKRIEGWTARLELGFAHHGVLHLWTAQAPWQDALDELITPRRRLGMQVDYPDHHELGDDEIAALADLVAAAPQFRRARITERTAAARQIPRIAELQDNPGTRWNVHSILRQAETILTSQVAAVSERLRARQDELAALLASDADFRAIRTADARQRFVSEWVLAHSDGLRMETWWVKELAALAVRAGKNMATQQLTL